MDYLFGIVLGGSNNVFDVECDENGTKKVRSCSLKSKRLKVETRYYNPLAPGNRVEIERDGEEKGQIVSLVPRKNEFSRWNVKGRAPQLLAANLDNVFLVTTPDEPPFRPKFLDRELAQAERENLNVVILVNKYDLPSAQNADFQKRLGAISRRRVAGTVLSRAPTIFDRRIPLASDLPGHVFDLQRAALHSVFCREGRDPRARSVS